MNILFFRSEASEESVIAVNVDNPGSTDRKKKFDITKTGKKKDITKTEKKKDITKTEKKKDITETDKKKDITRIKTENKKIEIKRRNPEDDGIIKIDGTMYPHTKPLQVNILKFISDSIFFH